MSDYKIESELGRGSYGTVYKVTSLRDNGTYVLKKISLSLMKQKQQQAALKEVQILKTLDHPNIIRYYTSFMEDESLHIVMEYAEKGDLYHKRKYFSEKDLWDFSYQICMAVEYLHSKNIIHRDIKCLNIFLTNDKKIKIGDLGVSKIVSSAAALQDTRVGTPLYLSPELVKQQPYDFKVDIWAIGCALYHLAQLEPPFQGDNLITLGNMIVNKKPKPLPQIYSNKLINFIEKFLHKKPSDRPTAHEAVLLIPTFVKNAHKEALNKLKFDDPQQQQQQAQQQQAQAQQALTKDLSMDKFRLQPIQKDQQKKQPLEQPVIQNKKTIESVVKIESNVSAVNFYQNQQSQARDKIIKRNKEFQTFDKEDQVSSPLNIDHISQQVVHQYRPVESQPQLTPLEKIISIPEKSIESNLDSQTKHATNRLEGGLSPLKSKGPYNMHIEQPSTKSFSQPINFIAQSKPNENLDSRNDFKQQPLKKGRYQSSNLLQQQSQVALQSTSDETKVTNKQGQMQQKLENALNRIEEEQKQENYPKIPLREHQAGVEYIQKGEFDIQQKQFEENLRKEMPFHVRPQTASASQIYQRKAQHSSSTSIKPGISLLRNLVKRNQQESVEIGSDLPMPGPHSQFQNRPFSAAVPSLNAFNKVKKNVMFQEDPKQHSNNSDVIIDDIIDDDANNDEYVQFNDQHIRKNRDFQQQQLNIQAPIAAVMKAMTGQRPFTANPNSRSTSQNKARHSFDNISCDRDRVSQQFKKTVVVAQTLDQQHPFSKPADPNQNKNELNWQTQEQFHNQFSKYYKLNLKKQTPYMGTGTHSSASQIINNNELKEKIKNFQPVSIHSQISGGDVDIIKATNQELPHHEHNLLSQDSEKKDEPLIGKTSPKGAAHSGNNLFRSSRYNQTLKQGNPGNRAQKKITIRDLEPVKQTQEILSKK